MIRIEMLPAKYGDCLLVEYGSGSEVHRLLVDGGVTATYAGPLKERLRELGPACPLERLVVTHIDDDHILGVLALLQNAPKAVAPAQVWFNGWDQLSDLLGEKEGDLLSARLRALGLPWNEDFHGGAVGVTAKGKLPAIDLPGDARLVVVSPGPDQLAKLAAEWKEVVDAARLGIGRKRPPGDDHRTDEGGDGDLLGKRPPPGRLEPRDVPRLAEDEVTSDASTANGSSIAFVLEHGASKVLLAGDAHPDVLAAGLLRYGGGKPVALDAVKLPHHASRRNVTPQLLAALSSPRYLVSTSGERFGHPDPEAIARVAMQDGPKKIYFNYVSDYTTPWRSAALADAYDLSAVYGDEGRLVVELGRTTTTPRRAARRAPGRPAGGDLLGPGAGSDLLGGEGGGAVVLVGSARGGARAGAGAGAAPTVASSDAGAAPARGRGDVRSRRGPRIASRARPPEEAAIAAAAAAQSGRFVQARVYARDGKVATELVKEPLRDDAEHEVQVWIGAPSDTVLRGSTVFPDGQLPPSGDGHLLTVVLVEPALSPTPQLRQVFLPATGDSARAAFALHTGRQATAVDARITVLYRNRVLQLLRLTGGIRRGRGRAAPLSLSVEAMVRADPGAAAAQPAFDASMIVGGSTQAPTLTAFRDGGAVHVTVNGVDELLRRIRQKLETVSDNPEIYGAPDDPDTADLLGELAALGAQLFTSLRDVNGMKEILAPSAKSIQIVSVDGEDVLPLEFCYTRAMPAVDAKMCDRWGEALDEGRCSKACPRPEKAWICPLGFLGLSATVERQRYTGEDAVQLGAGRFQMMRGPEADARRPLSPLRALVRATFRNAPGPDRAGFAAELAQVDRAVPLRREVKDWDGWVKAVDALHPSLLLLIAHTDEKRSRPLLVIGDQDALEVGNIEDAHVRGSKPSGAAPLVLLLGCRTGANPELPLANIASQFRRHGAAVVLGTISTVRGRYTAETARQIVDELKQHPGESFGTVLTDVRRALLRRGNPLGLSLMAFGDADWRV